MSCVLLLRNEPLFVFWANPLFHLFPLFLFYDDTAFSYCGGSHVHGYDEVDDNLSESTVHIRSICSDMELGRQRRYNTEAHN